MHTPDGWRAGWVPALTEDDMQIGKIEFGPAGKPYDMSALERASVAVKNAENRGAANERREILDILKGAIVELRQVGDPTGHANHILRQVIERIEQRVAAGR